MTRGEGGRFAPTDDDAGPEGTGINYRDEVVDSPYVSVAVRVRAFDGFDRVSGWSPTTGPQLLEIDHHPTAPTFRSATRIKLGTTSWWSL